MDELWYYSSGEGEKKGPVSGNDLRRMISNDSLRDGDLVWKEGFSDWMPLSSVPELHPQSSMPHGVDGIYSVPQGLSGWMTFVGVMNITAGAVNCLSCFGIIIGIPMIIAGVALLGAKNALSQMDRITADMDIFLRKLHTVMIANGVIYAITLIGIIIFLLFYAAVFFALLSDALGQV